MSDDFAQRLAFNERLVRLIRHQQRAAEKRGNHFAGEAKRRQGYDLLRQRSRIIETDEASFFARAKGSAPSL